MKKINKKTHRLQRHTQKLVSSKRSAWTAMNEDNLQFFFWNAPNIHKSRHNVKQGKLLFTLHISSSLEFEADRLERRL